jgi:hypothetical protein
MKERLVAFRQLLISDEKLSKPIEPGVRRFHDPASILRRTPASALLPCDSWSVPPDADLLANRFPVISLIRIQETLSSLRKGDDDGIEHCGELTDIMSMGPGDDQRQRDATRVHQEMTLASSFSPGLSDSDPLPLAREAL